jgi:hypothetical protein
MVTPDTVAPVASVTMPERALEGPLWAINEIRLPAKAAERARILNGIRVRFIEAPQRDMF